LTLPANILDWNFVLSQGPDFFYFTVSSILTKNIYTAGRGGANPIDFNVPCYLKFVNVHNFRGSTNLTGA
jgi:hypothetical protein